MKKMLVMVLGMTLLLGTAAFADDETFVRGQRMGQQLEGQALVDFQTSMLEEKEEWIEGLIEEGKITAEEGAAFMEEMKEHVENCDGSQTHMGQGLNLGAGEGFGAKTGNRQGNGDGTGRGMGNSNATRGRWQSN